MADHREQIETFFADYAERSNAALREPPQNEAAGISAAFAPFFVGVSPKGVLGGANDNDLREAVPQSLALYRKAGGTAMRTTRVKTTQLDDFNALVRVDWELDYTRKRLGRKGTMIFQNIYLVTFADGAPKIFAYITPDQDEALKHHGLI